MKILYNAEQIQERTKELACQINEDYKDKSLVIIGIMKGSLMFMMDLVKLITVDDIVLDYMTISSYHGTSSTGSVNITQNIRENIRGKHVLVVEDIVDTGLTLEWLMRHFRRQGVVSAECVTLLNKPDKPKNVIPKYVGFDIPSDIFVIGYGMDHNERFRNLPWIGIFEKK